MQGRNVFLTIALFLLSLGTAFAGAPEIKKDCSLCHITHGGMATGLLSQIPELCIHCHADRHGANDHPVGVVVKGPRPETLPLGKDGLITCITCHAPHGEGDFPQMLRMKFTELCTACHRL